MIARKFALVRADVESELESLNQLLDELNLTLKRFGKNPSSIEIRATGSILHDFYCGVEKIFERIASEIDGEPPKGENWHFQLLNRMTFEIPEVRPAVIGSGTTDRLKDYFRFRHLFRNVYGSHLEWGKIEDLTAPFTEILEAFNSDINRFLGFLDGLAQNCEE